MNVQWLLTADIVDNGASVSQEVIDEIQDDLQTYLGNYDPPGATTMGVLKHRCVQVANLELS